MQFQEKYYVLFKTNVFGPWPSYQEAQDAGTAYVSDRFFPSGSYFVIEKRFVKE